MKTSFRSNRRSRPEKEGAENAEVEKTESEELQQDEEKVDEELDMDGEEEEAGVEEFTLDRFEYFSQSIAAKARMNNKPFIIRICIICEYDHIYLILHHKCLQIFS